MPIFVTWDAADKSVIRLDYAEPISAWQEYNDAVDEAFDLARSVQHPVVVIHNTGTVKMPAGSAFPHIQRAMRRTPSNVTSMIAIVENRFARNLLPIILRPVGGNLQFAQSLGAAREKAHKEMVVG
jgi:hypothetical protein